MPSPDPDIAVVRRFFELANAREVDRALDLLDPGVEWENLRELPGGGVHYGPKGVEKTLRDQADVLQGFRVDPERVEKVGDQILAFVRIRGRPRESDLDVDMSVGQIWTVSHGRIVRFRPFLDRAEAVATAEEEAVPGHAVKSPESDG